MSDPKLIKTWKVTETNLEFARKALPQPDVSNSERYQYLLNEYQGYIEHNEFELALDMLEELGELVTCRGGFWRDLERAAETMELNDRIPYYKKKLKEALSILKGEGE